MLEHEERVSFLQGFHQLRQVGFLLRNLELFIGNKLIWVVPTLRLVELPFVIDLDALGVKQNQNVFDFHFGGHQVVHQSLTQS